MEPHMIPKHLKEKKLNLKKQKDSDNEESSYVSSQISRINQLQQDNQIPNQIDCTDSSSNISNSQSDLNSFEFFQIFQKFYNSTSHISTERVKFDYMKDLYNLELDTFPTDETIFSIQEDTLKSTQVNSKKLKKNWNDDERKLLVWIVGKFCASKQKVIDFKNMTDSDWNVIASMMNRRDGYTCKQKWLSMLKLPLFQSPWSVKEDQTLKEIYDEFHLNKRSNKWSSISDELNRRMNQNIHRTGKQCRERWNNHLNPAINRDPWGDVEDLNMLQLVLQNGKKWALISKLLNSPRNENSVKNRFNCLLRKEKSINTELEELSAESYLNISDELTPNDMRSIMQAIQKIKWRISQRSGTEEQMKQEDIEKLETIEKKEKIEKQSQNIKENDDIEVEYQQYSKLRQRNRKRSIDPSLEEQFDQELSLQNKLATLQLDQNKQKSLPSIQQSPSQNLPNNHIQSTGSANPTLTSMSSIKLEAGQTGPQYFQYILEKVENLNYEDLVNCTPCLVNTKKGRLYQLSSEQMMDYLQYQYQQSQINNHQLIAENNNQDYQHIDHNQQNLIGSQERLVRTLNTIEEFSSNPGSLQSVGHFLNFEQQCTTDQRLHAQKSQIQSAMNSESNIFLSPQLQNRSFSQFPNNIHPQISLQQLQNQSLQPQLPNYFNYLWNRGFQYQLPNMQYPSYSNENILLFNQAANHQFKMQSLQNFPTTNFIQHAQIVQPQAQQPAPQQSYRRKSFKIDSLSNLPLD